MNKLKVFLVTLTIIVLASICFTGMTMAAQVSWVNESKGRVHINGGVDDGYIVGATVCFIVDFKSGEKLVCGTVQSAEASNAVVKVDKNSAKRMKTIKRKLKKPRIKKPWKRMLLQNLCGFVIRKGIDKLKSI